MDAMYMKVGDIVTVQYGVAITAGGAGLVQFSITVPVNINPSANIMGQGIFSDGGNNVGALVTPNDATKVTVSFYASVTSSQTVKFSIAYRAA